MGTVGTVNTPESRMISSPFATFCTFWQHKVRVQCDVDSLGAEESTGTLADVRDIQVAELTFFPFAIRSEIVRSYDNQKIYTNYGEFKLSSDHVIELQGKMRNIN